MVQESNNVAEVPAVPQPYLPPWLIVQNNQGYGLYYSCNSWTGSGYKSYLYIKNDDSCCGLTHLHGIVSLEVRPSYDVLCQFMRIPYDHPISKYLKPKLMMASGNKEHVKKFSECYPDLSYRTIIGETSYNSDPLIIMFFDIHKIEVRKIQVPVITVKGNYRNYLKRETIIECLKLIP